jgi:hypothetical protein
VLTKGVEMNNAVSVAERFEPPQGEAQRELCRRSNAGIDIALFWDETTGRITVRVSDLGEGVDFEVHPPPRQALEAFNHPYVYADRARPYDNNEHLAA